MRTGESRNGRPPFKLSRQSAIAVLLLTVVYLCLELPFSAHLLDIVGTTSDADIIHETEVVGRLISGFAAALFVWGLLLIPAGRKYRWRPQGTALLCLAAAVPIVIGVYQAQEAIVEHFVQSSVAAERQQAFAILLFTQELQLERAGIKGLPLTTEQMRQADGKTLVAMLPFMVSAMSDIRERLEPSIGAFVGNRVRISMGGAQAFFNRAYVAPLRDTKDSYDSYRSGLGKNYEAKNKIDQKAVNGYDQYRRRLSRRYRGRPPSGHCPRIRRSVRQEGVPVPNSWDCWNRGVFIKSAQKQGYAQADQAFDREVKNAVGQALPKNLTTFKKFLAHSVVQTRWREEAGVPAGIRLQLGETPESFKKKVYEQVVRKNVSDEILRYNAETTAFEQGGIYFEDGERAMRALLVPPIALFFSLLGAFGHLLKSTITMVTIVRPQTKFWAKSSLAFAGLFVIATVPLAFSNSITRAPVYDRIEAVTRVEMSFFGGYLTRWVMRAEPLLYPLSHRVRTWVAPVFKPEDNVVTHLVSGDSPEEIRARTQPKALSSSEQRVATSKVEPNSSSSEPEINQPAPVKATTAASRPADQAKQSPAVKTVTNAQRGCPADLETHSHRGLRPAPENTTAAVLAAYKAGFTAPEIDIQRTSDGQWVLHHDLLTGRVVGPAGNLVSQMTLVQWLTSNVKGGSGPPSTLRDVLKSALPYLRNGRKINIEFKGKYNCPDIRKAITTMHSAGVSDHQLMLTSVDPNALGCMASGYTGYRGLVIADARESESLQKAGSKLGGRFGALAERGRTSLDSFLAGSLTQDRMAAFKKSVAGKSGYHISGLALRDDPQILTRAQENNLAIYTFSIRGNDEAHMQAVDGARQTTGLYPDGVIIDGSRDNACELLQ